jgi:hypothetical protein
VERVSDAGGVVTPVAASPISSDEAWLAKDAGHLYWIGDGGVIRKVELATGTVILLVASGARELAVDATSVYWTVSGSTYYPPLGSLWKLPK